MEKIDLAVLDGVLDRYQAHIDVTRSNEVYKWEAVRHFKETYDPDADNLPAMLEEAFQVSGKKKLNLAFGPSWFPIGMLSWFMGVDSQGTLAALEGLYDEERDLKARMVGFEEWARQMLDRVNAEQVAAGNDPAKNHYQDTRSMSLYLAFMYPESHYFYKTRMYTEAAKFLGVGWPGNKFDKVIAYREMCDQILAHLKETRSDLIEESDATLGELAEYDPAHHMLVQDIVHFITTYDKDYRKGGEGVDLPDDERCPYKEENDPDISVEGPSPLAEQEQGEEPDGSISAIIDPDYRHLSVEDQFFRWNVEVNGRKEGYARANQMTLAKRRFPDLMDECLPQYESAFQCTDCHEIEAAYDRAIASPRNNDEHSHVSAALGNYLKFLKWRASSGDYRLEEVAPSTGEPELYTETSFLADVYVLKDDFDDMKALLGRKRNLILQGSPGTGKTFCARRLAWAMMGCKDDSRITFVQFHQSTTYDDFVCGYRPDGNGGFAVKDGPFVRACREAARDAERPHFVIIDEINRANISKVLGELLMLIEADHRGESTLLTVADKELTVPANLYIIGMMNTADRGLALIDYALRRRFAFFDMAPALEHPKFLEQLVDCGDSHMASLVEATKELNKDIAADAALGEGFRIGHSYFCGAKDARLVLRYELAPLIREYWFDDPKKARQEFDKLEQALK